MLVEEFRGNLLENLHEGRICVVDQSGAIIGSVGDAHAFTFFRSAAKPLQLLPLFARGLDQKFGLTEEEMTICAASHLGEDIHIGVLLSIMEKTGFREDELIMKPTTPSHPIAKDNFVREGRRERKLYHNCSGKHLALMLLQRELTGSAEDYWKLDSAVQQEVLSTISLISSFPAQEIVCGIDGCGVPVFAVPLKNIALAYMRLANPAAVDNDALSLAIKKVSDCFLHYPLLTRGHDSICSELNKHGNFVAKIGAEAVYGLGLKNERIGISLKIADGSAHTIPIVIAETLRQLGYCDESVFATLENLKSCDKFNDNNDKIGYYKTVFRL